MDHQSTERGIIALDPWLLSPAGLYLMGWEQARLDALTADIFGFNAIQLGMPQLHGLAANRMPHKWLTDTQLPPGREVPVVVVHDFTELPFASQSLDLVLLPHVLEFSSDPHQVLREVERVLIPEGQIIISGFNPASMWGLRQVAGRLTGAHFLPLDGEFISVARLKDWLKLLNMEVNRGHFGCYAPPFRTNKWRNRFAFMEKAGDRWWPYLGAVYVVQAIKRVKGMRMVGPAWSKASSRSRQAVPATNQVQQSPGPGQMTQQEQQWKEWKQWKP
jgi:SAM-dependent methyltransferase